MSTNMQLSEKIFNERKRMGWSQEQFAEHMEVSRQAVSKWESGQSLPDLDKLVLMSQIFGVSTDYLLKEETFSAENASFPTEDTIPAENASSLSKESIPIGNASSLSKESIPIGNTKTARILRSEEILEYRKVCFKASKAIAFGVVLCMVGVILCLALENMASYELDAAALLLCITPAVILFILSGMKLDKFTYLKKETFQLAETNRKPLKEEYEKYSHTFMMRITTGVALCIAAVAAYLIIEAIEKHSQASLAAQFDIDTIPTIVLLSFIAIAVYLFVSSGIRKDYYDVLLQQNDFTDMQKKKRDKNNPLSEAVAGAYWCLVTAGFLAYSFITGDWGNSWIVWPVAGCIFGAISIILAFYAEKAEK